MGQAVDRQPTRAWIVLANNGVREDAVIVRGDEAGNKKKSLTTKDTKKDIKAEALTTESQRTQSGQKAKRESEANPIPGARVFLVLSLLFCLFLCVLCG
jgi:hypothetical protein